MLPAIVAGGAPIVGGVVGHLLGAGDRAAAAKATADAIAYLESVGIPSIEAQQIIMTNPEFVGQFSAQQETAEQMGPSAMQDIQTDPRLQDAQMNALAQLQEQGTNPLTDMEKASLNQSRRDVASEAQARQNSILQNMAQRGAGGSGAELAAQLASSQASAQRQGEEADRMKAMAQQRALQAISESGNMAGNIRGQAFGEDSAKASAMDAIAQFNAANRQNVQSRNVSSANQAGMREADMRQGLEGTRADNSNYQQQYNKQLLQQDYQNRLAKAQSLAQAKTGQAGQYQQQAAQTADMWSKIGTGVGQGAATFAKKASTVKEPENPINRGAYATAEEDYDTDKKIGWNA